MKSSEASNLPCKSYSYFFLTVACPDLRHEPYFRASPRFIASVGAQTTGFCMSLWLAKPFIFTLKCPTLSMPR